MNRVHFALIGLLLAAPAWAQDTVSTAAQATGDSAATDGSGLDLSVPDSPIRYRNESGHAGDPPGTWYGDTSGVPASKQTPAVQNAQAQAEACQGQLHGAVSAGMGYSRRGGNSNWQAANLNSCKTYYDDDGNAHQIGVSISVGKESGPGYLGGPFGPRW